MGAGGGQGGRAQQWRLGAPQRPRHPGEGLEVVGHAINQWRAGQAPRERRKKETLHNQRVRAAESEAPHRSAQRRRRPVQAAAQQPVAVERKSRVDGGEGERTEAAQVRLDGAARSAIARDPGPCAAPAAGPEPMQRGNRRAEIQNGMAAPGHFARQIMAVHARRAVPEVGLGENQDHGTAVALRR
ncbi:MAG: hypothetical protein BWZ10_01773 [candidate division BRC1 bacterium ADurb.BinA364]|nr:MAG: hypothetical protein BWZ10_01773 [candidate division BRC1 bacterium ADurb.BinA364]